MDKRDDGEFTGHWPDRAEFPAPTPGAAIFLDFDGTLVCHAGTPADVRIDDALIALLEALCAANGGALALISGRSIADLDAMLAPARFVLAGQHGAERRSADGTVHRHAPPAERLAEATEAFRTLVGRHPALLLEEKGTSLAVHYRADPTLEPLVDAEARRIVGLLEGAFVLQAGKFVAELRPSGRDKGTAIAEYLAEPPFAGRSPVFVGDDLTDEFGFDLVNRLGGQSVKVGPGPTRARWRLRDSAEVRSWLAAGLRRETEG